jgi:hypothetical protein
MSDNQNLLSGLQIWHPMMPCHAPGDGNARSDGYTHREAAEDCIPVSVFTG